MAKYNVTVKDEFEISDEEIKKTAIYRIGKTIEKYVLNVKTLSTKRVSQRKLGKILGISRSVMNDLIKKLGINVKEGTESKSTDEKVMLILELFSGKQIIKLQAYAQELNTNKVIQKAWKELEEGEKEKSKSKVKTKAGDKEKQAQNKAKLDAYLRARHHIANTGVKENVVLMAKAKAELNKDAAKYKQLSQAELDQSPNKAKYELASLILDAINSGKTLEELEGLGQRQNSGKALSKLELVAKQSPELYEQLIKKLV